MGKKDLSRGSNRSYSQTIDISIKDFLASSGLSDRIDFSQAIKEGYFSIRQFSERAGYSLAMSAKMLEGGFKSGKLKRVFVRGLDGKTARYYRPVTTKTKT